MPKKRLIASLIIKNGIVVQSVGFKTYLPVGRAEIAARFLDDWGIDEIALLDIDASPEGRLIDPELVRRVSQSCYVPVTAGGGIRTIDDIRALLMAGADKIAINRLAFEDPAMLKEASRVFGSQCIVASVDARQEGVDGYQVFTDSGRQATGLDPADFVKSLADAGAGEILLNSIDRDGRKAGYDLALIDRVAHGVDVPIIACGGAGRPEHFLRVLEHPDVSAAAAANIFHFTEHSVALIKSALSAWKLDVRMDSYADYTGFSLTNDGRLLKQPDSGLLDQFFEFVPEEVI